PRISPNAPHWRNEPICGVSSTLSAWLTSTCKTNPFQSGAQNSASHLRTSVRRQRSAGHRQISHRKANEHAMHSADNSDGGGGDTRGSGSGGIERAERAG